MGAGLWVTLCLNLSVCPCRDSSVLPHWGLWGQMLANICQVLSDPLTEGAEIFWVQIWLWVLIFGCLILWVLLYTLVMSKKDFLKHKDVKGLGNANNNIIHQSFCLRESFSGTHNLTYFYSLPCSVGGNVRVPPWASAFPGTLSSSHGWAGTEVQGVVTRGQRPFLSQSGWACPATFPQINQDMQSHPGSLAAQCRTSTRNPKSLLSWAALCSLSCWSCWWEGRNLGDVLTQCLWVQFVEEEGSQGRNDPLFGWLLRRDSSPSCQKLCLVIWRCFSWWSISKEPLSSSSWAAPGDTSKTWSCQLSLGNAAFFA